MSVLRGKNYRGGGSGKVEKIGSQILDARLGRGWSETRSTLPVGHSKASVKMGRLLEQQYSVFVGRLFRIF